MQVTPTNRASLPVDVRRVAGREARRAATWRTRRWKSRRG